MNEYEAYWSVEIRKRMRPGYVLMGENTIIGSGKTPAEALAHAQSLYEQRQLATKGEGECLAREWVTP